MAGWRTIRVFISSTFKDMQAERDHLVRFVFPAARQRLMSRRLHLVDVDLRWGVSSDQNALDLCIDEIDRCRPRFICLLGGRYGWVPPGSSRSITAAEICHGALDHPDVPGFRHFYFRAPAATGSIPESEAREYREPAGSPEALALEELKARVRSSRAMVPVASGRTALSPLPVYEYSCAWDGRTRQLTGLDEFGQRVLAALLESVDAEFGPQIEADSDEMAEESSAIEAFIEGRMERFVIGSRAPILDRLLERATDPRTGDCTCVAGSPGSGKSSLLAGLVREVDRFASSRNSPRVIAHFVGASARSTNVRLMLRRLCHELALATQNRASPPEPYDELRAAFADLLARAAAASPVLLVVDAVNQFDAAHDPQSLDWLPEPLPAGVHAVLSMLPGRALEAARRRRSPAREIQLDSLTADDAGAIIDGFLQRYRKSLDAAQRDALLAKADAGSPLYLCTALEELRTLGRYEEIAARIRELPGDTPRLFDWLLSRLEKESGFRDASGALAGSAIVPRYCAFLAVGRVGMTQAELVDLVSPGDPQGNLAALQRLLRPYLMLRGDLIDFFHLQLREAVVRRYLGNAEALAQAHHGVVNWFRARLDPAADGTWTGDSPRAWSELPYHLVRARDRQLLREIASGRFLVLKAQKASAVEALVDARQIAEALADRGDEDFAAILECARTHAAIASAVREKPGDLKRAVAAGNIEILGAAFKVEADEPRRGLLMAAVSTLLEQAGHSAAAREIWELGSSMVRREFDREDRDPGFGGVTMALAAALVLRDRALAESPPEGPVEELGAGQLHWRHALALTLGTNRLCSSLWFELILIAVALLALSLMILLMISYAPAGSGGLAGDPTIVKWRIELVDTWRRMGPFALPIASLLFLLYAYGCLCWLLRRQLTWIVPQVREILAKRFRADRLGRLERVLAGLPAAVKNRVWLEPFARLLCEEFQRGDAATRGRLLARAANLGKPIAMRLASELDRLEADEIERIFRTIPRGPISEPGLALMLLIVGRTAARAFDSELVVSLLPSRFPVSAISALAALPRARLGQSILEHLALARPPGPGGSMPRKVRSFLLRVLVRLEGKLLPGPYDPYGVSPLLEAEGATACRRVLWERRPADHLANTILAQDVLQGTYHGLAVYPPRHLTRVVGKLGSAGFLRSRAGVLLNVMQESRLVEALARVAPFPARTAGSPHQASEKSVLQNSLPIHPAGLGIALEWILGWTAALALILSLSRLAPDTASFGPFAVAGSAGLALGISLLRLYQSGAHRRQSSDLEVVEYEDVMSMRGTKVAGLISLLLVSADLLLTSPGRPPLIQQIMALVRQMTPQAMASLKSVSLTPPDWSRLPGALAVWFLQAACVPALIARWRGAGLLYPSTSRLWLQRALLAPAALAVLSGLALILRAFSAG